MISGVNTHYATKLSFPCPHCRTHYYIDLPAFLVAINHESVLECVHCKKSFMVELRCLPRAAQLRIGADEAGQNVDTQATYNECGNCGVARFAHGWILEACPNCGDDEIDLSQLEQVP
jgi:predicted RNA-binding Zn-ribbon protein involved in translation (DUF1610 family)